MNYLINFTEEELEIIINSLENYSCITTYGIETHDEILDQNILELSLRLTVYLYSKQDSVITEKELIKELNLQ